MQNFSLATVLLVAVISISRGQEIEIPKPDASIQVETWGRLPDGTEVRLYKLGNKAGTIVTVSDYGALLVSVETPGRDGKAADVTLSYHSLDDALAGGVNGSVIGRFANRIDKGGFTIDGKRFDLDSVNPKSNVHIHGGKTGFHRQMWKAEILKSSQGNRGVRFSLTSPDRHEGYPGKIEVSVTYSLTPDNALRLEYEGATDAPTHLNLTNHVYFNLAGSGDVLGQILQLDCPEYLAMDDRKIPTGELLPVEGTPFDFQNAKPVGQDIEKVEGGGYDHCFVIPGFEPQGKLRSFATLTDPSSGRKMEISTTMPGVQIYTANHLKGNPFPKWGGICFETQFYPDTPNRPEFPSSLLRPGETYHEVTEFRFSVEE